MRFMFIWKEFTKKWHTKYWTHLRSESFTIKNQTEQTEQTELLVIFVSWIQFKNNKTKQKNKHMEMCFQHKIITRPFKMRSFLLCACILYMFYTLSSTVNSVCYFCFIRTHRQNQMNFVGIYDEIMSDLCSFMRSTIRNWMKINDNNQLTMYNRRLIRYWATFSPNL